MMGLLKILFHQHTEHCRPCMCLGPVHMYHLVALFQHRSHSSQNTGLGIGRILGCRRRSHLHRCLLRHMARSEVSSTLIINKNGTQSKISRRILACTTTSLLCMQHSVYNSCALMFMAHSVVLWALKY